MSTIAGTWTFAAVIGIAAIGWWAIPAVLGPKTFPVYPLTLILLIGYGTANLMNWNRTLLLAFGKPSYPLLVALSVGAIEILLTLWLVPIGGYLAMGAILSAYLATTIGITAWRGWHEIRVQEGKGFQQVEVASKDVSL